MDDNDKKLTIPLQPQHTADADEVKPNESMDDVKSSNECYDYSMYAYETEAVNEVLNYDAYPAPSRDNARTRRRRARQRNKRKLANQQPSTSVAKQSPGTSAAKQSPGTSAAKQSPGTLAAKLSPGTSVANLSPSASVAKLSPAASVANLSPATSVANLSLATSVANLSPATSVANLSLANLSPATSVANLSSATSVANLSPATSVANLSLAQPVAKRSPEPVPPAGRIRKNADLRQDLNQSIYNCGICNIEIPSMYMEEHISSIKHKTCQTLLKIATERGKKDLIFTATVMEAEANSHLHYFCEPCAKVVKQNKHEHELTRDHFKSLKHDRILNDLLQILIDKEYMEYADFGYLRTENLSSNFGKYDNEDDDNDSDKDMSASHTSDLKGDESTYSV